MNRLTELQLDLMEHKAYRELQVPGDGGSEDVYFKMAIQSLQNAIEEELYYKEQQIKENRKDRNRYRLNKKAKQKHYDYINTEFGGWDRKPWYNPYKKRCAEAVAKERKFKRRLRRIPVGKEEFSLRGSGYQDVYQWTWDLD